MNKIKYILVLILGLFITTTVNAATKYEVFIEDNAKLFSQGEIANLKANFQPATKYGHFVIITIGKDQNFEDDYATNYYTNHYGDENGVLFVINLNISKIRLVPAGDCIDIFEISDIQDIYVSSTPYFKKYDFYGAVTQVYLDVYDIYKTRGSELINNGNTNTASGSYIKEEINGNTLLIDDKAALFSEDEINSLHDIMKDSTQYGHIAFVTLNENSYSTQTFARDFYHTTFGTQSGTLFVIDMDNRYMYIFSDGQNYKVINSSKADSITDNVYKYATQGNYYKCASEAFSQIYTVLDGGKIAEPMKNICNVFLSLTFGFFLCFFYATAVSRIKVASTKEIMNNIKRNVSIQNIVPTKTGTRRVYSPQSDSSSGGSSGGGGGGGSSGGGGGHSF